MNPSTRAAALLAVLLGVALWLLGALVTPTREPWDSRAYWFFVYPLALAACALLGHRYPTRSWRWALIVFESQFLAMCARNGELGNLWPMGMLLFAFVALPGVAAARVAARFSRGSGQVDA
jgi:hypothetical protein